MGKIVGWIPPKTIDDFRLGFCSTGFYDEYKDSIAEESGIIKNNYPALTGRVTIPYIVNSEVVDLLGRLIDKNSSIPTYKSLFGTRQSRGSNFLFNHNVISKSNRIIITEGEFKAIVASQYGYPVVATPGIFGWQDEWNTLLKDKEVILAADFDKISGLRSPAYLMAKLLIKGIPHLKIALMACAKHTTKDKIDIDSLIVAGNVKTFDNIINGAMDANIWLSMEERKGNGRKQ